MTRWLLLFAVAACSSSSSMADIDQGLDADASGCGTKPNYGAVGARTGTVGVDGASPTLTVRIDGNTDFDALYLKLVDGRGVFTNGLAPGTYKITGGETDYYACGLCVQLLANTVTGPSNYYLAQAGTMTLTAISPIAGNASNLAFAEVDLIGKPVVDGCETKIDSVSFTTN